MRKLLCLLAIAAALPLVGQSATGESLTLNGNAHWGASMSFDGVYLREHGRDWPPRIHNPVVAAQCDNGWRGAALGYNVQNIGGGFREATFGDVFPQGSGTSSCQAWLEFTDGKTDATEILASTEFSID